MTIIFSGNKFKYELESVVKLFFPFQTFTMLYDERKADGDYCFIRRKKGKSKTLLYVVVSIDNKRVKCKCFTDNGIENYEGECEIALARMLFLNLSKLTGLKPEWGILTGIRPVKRVNSMLNEGKEIKEIFDEFQNKFLVSEKKTCLAYKTAIVQKNFLKTPEDKSFSLYVSIPFCPSRCSYCSFVSQTVERTKKLIPEYIDKLCIELHEISLIAKNLGLKLDTIYFGGGTPTAISALQLDRIMCTIADNFDLSNLREYTVEAGRADTITLDKLNVIKNNGATRISINPQTLNDDVLVAIGRKHTAKQVIDSFKFARQAGFHDINMDIIAGLPTDNIDSFKNTVDKIIELAPENVTVHTLSIKRSADLCGQNVKEIYNDTGAMVDYAWESLAKAGYAPYYLYRQKDMLSNLENVGYSKKGYENLYNIYIMEENQTILATGAGASTKLVYNGKLTRIYNYKFPLDYNRDFNIMLEKKKEIYNFFEDEVAHEEE